MKLKQRLLMLGAAGLVAASAIGLVGWFGQQMLLDSADRQSVAAKAVRAQMQVDMMHDALNSDVPAPDLADQIGEITQAVYRLSDRIAHVYFSHAGASIS